MSESKREIGSTRNCSLDSDAACKKAAVDDAIKMPLANNIMQEMGTVRGTSKASEHGYVSVERTPTDVVELLGVDDNRWDNCNSFAKGEPDNFDAEMRQYDRKCSSEGGSPVKFQQRASSDLSSSRGELELGEAKPFIDRELSDRGAMQSVNPNNYVASCYSPLFYPHRVPGYTMYGRHSPPFFNSYNFTEPEAKSAIGKKKLKNKKRLEGNHTKTTEDIPGFRGYQSVESLLQYIEGPDAPSKANDKCETNKAKKTKSTPTKKSNHLDLSLPATTTTIENQRDAMGLFPGTFDAQKSSSDSDGDSSSQLEDQKHHQHDERRASFNENILSKNNKNNNNNAGCHKGRSQQHKDAAVEMLVTVAGSGVSLHCLTTSTSQHSDTEFIPVTNRKLKKRYNPSESSTMEHSSNLYRAGQDHTSRHRSITPPFAEGVNIAVRRRRSAEPLHNKPSAPHHSDEERIFNDQEPTAMERHHCGSVSVIDRPTYASVCQQFNVTELPVANRHMMTTSAVTSSDVDYGSVIPESSSRFSNTGSYATATAPTLAPGKAASGEVEGSTIDFLDLASTVAECNKHAPVSATFKSHDDTVLPVSSVLHSPASKKAVEFLDRPPDTAHMIAADITFGFDDVVVLTTTAPLLASSANCSTQVTTTTRSSGTVAAVFKQPTMPMSRRAADCGTSAAVTSTGERNVNSQHQTQQASASFGLENKKNAPLSVHRPTNHQFQSPASVVHHRYCAMLASFTNKAWVEFTNSKHDDGISNNNKSSAHNGTRSSYQLPSFFNFSRKKPDTSNGTCSQRSANSLATVLLRKPRSRGSIFKALFCCWGLKISRRNHQLYSGTGELVPNSSPVEDGSSEYISGQTCLNASLLLPVQAPCDVQKGCLIIDLDETLVHSSFKPVKNPDFIIPVEIDGVIHQVYVLKRPFVDEFLQRIGKLYECILFTASLAKYADPVADLLDRWGVFRARLFREACVFHKGNYVKDLNRLGRDLKKTVIVDNSPASYAFHPDNAIPVNSWFDDMTDTELLDLIPLLEKLAHVDNIYSVLRNSNSPCQQR